MARIPFLILFIISARPIHYAQIHHAIIIIFEKVNIMFNHPDPKVVPEILQTDVAGRPQRWITIEDAVSYYAKEMVLYELGNPIATFRGGVNRISNTQSIITTNSIIAVKGSMVRDNDYKRTPALTNEALFARDQHLCAYCGFFFMKKELSREHIHPVHMGGPNVWNNVVTACKVCNNKKGGNTLKEARMELLYLPYTPDRYESFILTQGKKILADQMQFLMKKVPNTSRLKQH